MICLKNEAQIEKMRDAGKVLYEVESQLKEMIRPGITTASIDVKAEQLIRKAKAVPSSLHFEGYPCSICTSVNDEVVHGIPSDRRVLHEGDIVSVDCTILYNGWQADSAFTAGVGQISEKAAKLIRVTEECFWLGIRQMIVGNRVGDYGSVVEKHARENGFNPIRDYTGHGIGRDMHEDPYLYNYGDPGRGLRFRAGMTIACEPMIATGDWHLMDDPDGWCVRTRDHGLCSHYEHTVAIREDGLPEVLTIPGFTWEGRE